ncbi:MAG TPA: phage tail protein [Jatrophihabitantaceae bacterium]|jgi:phage tail-like protein
MADRTALPPLAMYYTVLLEGLPLGTVQLGPFSGCTGLDAHYEPFEWKEGGDNGTVVRLPGRLVYSSVKLSHQVSEKSGALLKWFTQISVTASRGSATITLFADDGQPVAYWRLQGVWPVSYTGPSLTTGPAGEAVAVETIELAHEGFMT